MLNVKTKYKEIFPEGDLFSLKKIIDMNYNYLYNKFEQNFKEENFNILLSIEEKIENQNLIVSAIDVQTLNDCHITDQNFKTINDINIFNEKIISLILNSNYKKLNNKKDFFQNQINLLTKYREALTKPNDQQIYQENPKTVDDAINTAFPTVLENSDVFAIIESAEDKVADLITSIHLYDIANGKETLVDNIDSNKNELKKYGQDDLETVVLDEKHIVMSNIETLSCHITTNRQDKSEISQNLIHIGIDIEGECLGDAALDSLTTADTETSVPLNSQKISSNTVGFTNTQTFTENQNIKNSNLKFLDVKKTKEKISVIDDLATDQENFTEKLVKSFEVNQNKKYKSTSTQTCSTNKIFKSTSTQTCNPNKKFISTSTQTFSTETKLLQIKSDKFNHKDNKLKQNFICENNYTGTANSILNQSNPIITNNNFNLNATIPLYSSSNGNTQTHNPVYFTAPSSNHLVLNNPFNVYLVTQHSNGPNPLYSAKHYYAYPINGNLLSSGY